MRYLHINILRTCTSGAMFLVSCEDGNLCDPVWLVPLNIPPNSSFLHGIVKTTALTQLVENYRLVNVQYSRNIFAPQSL